MLAFLKEYGALIVTAICTILSFLTLILKNRPKTLDEFVSIVNEILKDVPYCVAIQELKIGSGKGIDKKSAVIADCLKRIESRLDRSLSKEESDYCVMSISSMVEATLDAPQKKGVQL